ncbi:PilZ domain-containing protein [Sphingomonas sp. HF-S4]|uniref:PilZ domain-containing protein n=1 Tax=Sphingomonas agrestis TaxID=3080540 RepID=A0ABU3Y5F2_9SPHN|nr:PilZ domain-containing protein [Sphingomonas sp. HF-S4]MDV3456640.1 PilZ domain-containing protein [Sphingomonas sp. HF-S4]
MNQALRSATIFSLSADPPRAVRQQPDTQAAFDAAWLASDTERFACSLQRLSSAGATLQIGARLAEAESMHLEMASGQHVAGRIDWCADGECGFVFDEPIDIISTLARTLANLPAERRAMPRVEINQLVSIRSGGKVEHARTRNISQGGVGIDTRLELAVGDAVHLTFDALRPLDGIVRWIRDGQAGIAFHEELGWQTLMPWFRHAQRAQARTTPTPQNIESEGMIPDKHAIRLDAPASVREGVRWWNARVRGITAHLVELETRAALAPGAQLWVSLPEIGGGPANVIEAAHNRILCEFRLPLRPRDLSMVSGGRAPREG